MRVFQMVMAVLFCAALTFYLWVAVPRVQAQDTSMPVLTDETDGKLALSVTAPESAYCAGLHAEDAHDGDLRMRSALRVCPRCWTATVGA